MREITDEQEVADLHAQALGQQNQTEDPEPSATIWAAIVSTTGDLKYNNPIIPDNWFLVTQDTLGSRQAFAFKDNQEAMAALTDMQDMFRTWLGQA